MSFTTKQLRWIAVGVLLAAFALRAYDLGGPSLWFDEAVYANNSAQPFDAFITLTRRSNSAPIALPLLLWLPGNAIRDPFSIRFPSLIFGVLAVAMMLRLPKVGVSRKAASIAAVWLAFSPMQIQYSQEVREYSLSVLGALLLLYGLLHALRSPERFPYRLCIAVVLAPNLSYGLSFAVATALGMYAIAGVPARRAAMGRLLVLGGTFVAAALLSYTLLARDQLANISAGGYNTYLAPNFPSGDVLDAASWLRRQGVGILVLSLGGKVSALLGAAAIAVYAVRQLRGWFIARARIDVIPFAATALAAVVAVAAFLKLYPFGYIRQNLFITPWVICAAACAFVELSGRWRVRDGRLRDAALFGGVALMIGVSFVSGIRSAYRAIPQDIAGALAAVGPGASDRSVYLDRWAAPAASFHYPQRAFGLMVESDESGIVRELSSVPECRFHIVATHRNERYEPIVDELRRRGMTVNRIFYADGAAAYEVDRC